MLNLFIVSNSSESNSLIVDMAHPSSLDSLIILLIALIVGAVIPFAVLFLVRNFGNTVRTRADLGSLRIPFLSEIPVMSSRRHWKHLPYARKPQKEDGKSTIVVQHGSRDAVNEVFRVLRTNLDFMVGKDGKENEKGTALFRKEWFYDFMDLALDSRFWGFVPQKAMVGKSIIIFYPFTERWGATR